MELGKNRPEASTVTHMMIFAVSLVLLLLKLISMMVTLFLFFCSWNSTRLWWTEHKEKNVGMRTCTICRTCPWQKRGSSTHSLAPPAEKIEQTSERIKSLCCVRHRGHVCIAQCEQTGIFNALYFSPETHMAMLAQGCAHTDKSVGKGFMEEMCRVIALQWCVWDPIAHSSWLWRGSVL